MTTWALRYESPEKDPRKEYRPHFVTIEPDAAAQVNTAKGGEAGEVKSLLGFTTKKDISFRQGEWIHVRDFRDYPQLAVGKFPTFIAPDGVPFTVLIRVKSVEEVAPDA